MFIGFTSSTVCDLWWLIRFDSIHDRSCSRLLLRKLKYYSISQQNVNDVNVRERDDSCVCLYDYSLCAWRNTHCNWMKYFSNYLLLSFCFRLVFIISCGTSLYEGPEWEICLVIFAIDNSRIVVSQCFLCCNSSGNGKIEVNLFLLSFWQDVKWKWQSSGWLWSQLSARWA